MRQGERRKQAIYDAVHEQVMRLRVRWATAKQQNPAVWNWDAVLSDLQHDAASAAVKASTEPLKRRARV